MLLYFTEYLNVIQAKGLTVTLYHQYSSLVASIGAIRYQDVVAALKKADKEHKSSVLSLELNSLSAYSQQSEDVESRDSVLKEIKLFMKWNYVLLQNNLIELDDYEGLKNFRELISDLKAAVEIISMGENHEQYIGENMMVGGVLTQ